jgi:hypothetical protein
MARELWRRRGILDIRLRKSTAAKGERIEIEGE